MSPRIRANRSLQFEFLERREVMAAGITASLSKGVLTVNGTDGNDTIKFWQTAGMISISGFNGSFAASNVSTIVVNCNKGNDSISLASLSNGGKQALSEEIKINSGPGKETVRLADGRDVIFSGLGRQLKVTTTGAATVDGKTVPSPAPTPPTPTPAPTPPTPSGNWFDANVLDAALRSLGNTLFKDGVLDRNDTIALLRSAKDGDVVDATEFADLKKIVANTSMFGSLDHVKSLATYVVMGSAANGKYQGAALGNLAAGSSATQMELLVDKWFLGMDRPTADGTYRQVAGQLFVNGASYTDVRQGYVGDCYFMATLAETALKSPSTINNMFVVNGDGTFTVKFYNGSTPAYVTVDNYLPTNSSGFVIYAGLGMSATNANNELWTSLAEKAYVQLNEMGWTRSGLSGSGQNAYAAISGGYCFAALGHVTGAATTPFTALTTSTALASFEAAYNQGKLIEFASKSTPASSSVVGGHAYAVIGYDAKTQTVTLFNPWGTNYAPVVMTWAQLKDNFSYFDRTA